MCIASRRRLGSGPLVHRAVLCGGATVLAAVFGFVGEVRAERVTGAVVLPSSGRTAAQGENTRPNHYWEEPNGYFPTRQARRSIAGELIVVLVGTAQPTEPPPNRIEIRGGAFVPQTIAIRADAPLEIVNTDPCSHELASPDLDSLHASDTPAGGTLTVDVAGANSFTVQDQVLRHLRGTVHVLENLVARTTVNATGAFRFENVPAGNYTLEVYRGAQKVAATSISVEADLELSAPLPLRRTGR